uniref:Fe2OG dioxygenase domain-containing protein n=1 Tax=Proboscia inermis TaxID=420281 RepID=A0A7S0GFX7_9STRA|mmetsp:Transcript_30197/g.30556  ORF Transcript_30197/g.30556 Transcript_30197/m.30556 type:complete len:314 (+) Transcript_30197:58-999(+)
MQILVPILILLPLGVKSWHIHSFSTNHILRSSTHTTLNKNQRDFKPIQLSQSDVFEPSYSSEVYFWSKERTEDEIIKYCARSLFPHEEFSVARKRIEVISPELPLLVIHDFLPKDMCEEIIKKAEQNGNLKRSTLGNSQEESTERTSSTTWLRKEQCEIPLEILSNKISRLAGIPSQNCENFQVVRYNGNGEKFDLHTDHLDSFNDLDVRGRLATCMLYLNSARSGSECGGFEGGCTQFPEYDVEVQPKRGSVAFWFNTVERPAFNDSSEGRGFSDESFLNVDLRSRHAGTPVVGNEKWVCNRWMHPVPFMVN